MSSTLPLREHLQLQHREGASVFLCLLLPPLRALLVLVLLVLSVLAAALVWGLVGLGLFAAGRRDEPGIATTPAES